MINLVDEWLHIAIAFVVSAVGLVALWHEIKIIQTTAEMRELVSQHATEAIKELARLTVSAKSETTRIAVIRELLDRGYGKPTQSLDGKFDGPPVVTISPKEAKY